MNTFGNIVYVMTLWLSDRPTVSTAESKKGSWAGFWWGVTTAVRLCSSVTTPAAPNLFFFKTSIAVSSVLAGILV